jgi:tetratricopeptide (TPR) repeat protein
MLKISTINEPDLFTRLCKALFAAEYEDFQDIDDSGGDEGNDGYVPSEEILFAFHCPEKPKNEAGYIKKINEDLAKAINLRDKLGYKIKKWIFVTPSPLRNPVIRHITSEATNNGFKGIPWSEAKLTDLFTLHDNLQSQFPDLIQPDISNQIKELRVELLSEINGTSEIKVKYENRIFEGYNKRIIYSKEKMDKGLYKSAKDEYLKIIDEMKHDDEEIDNQLFFKAYNNLGVCRRSLGDYDDALKDFEEAVSYDSNNLIGIANLAFTLMLKEDYEKALDYLEKGLRIDPDNENCISVKAHTLVMLKKYDEAITFLNEKHKDDLALYYSSIIDTYNGNYEEADIKIKTLLEKKPDDFQYLYIASNNMLVWKDEYVKNNFYLYSQIAQYIKDDFNTLLGWLTKAKEILKNQERPKLLADIFSYLSAAHLGLANYKKAEENAREAINQDENCNIAYLNRGIAEFHQKEFVNAIKSINKYLSLVDKQENEIIQILALSYLSRGEIKEAKRVLKDFIDKDFNKDDLAIIELVIQAFRLDIEYDDCDKYLQILKDKFETNPHAIRIRARYLMDRNHPGAKELLSEALSYCDNDNEKTMINIELANLLINESSFDEALKIYSQFISEKEHSYVNNRYLECLCQLGRYKEALLFIDNLHKNAGRNDYVDNILASIQISLGNLKEASILLKALYQRNPDKIDFLLHYGICRYRISGNAEEAIRNFNEVKNKVSGGDNLITLSHGYLSIKQYSTALELAYKALQEEPKNPRVHLAYVNILLAKEQVEGQEIDEIYTKAFQDTISNFNKRFPYEHGLTMINVDGSLTEVTKQLDESFNYLNKVFDIYNNNQLAFYSIAKFTSKSIFDLWKGLRETEDLCLKISYGTYEERTAEIACIEESKEVVIDIISLFTLTYSSQLNLLKKIFSKIYVHQSVMDELILRINEFNAVKKAGQDFIAKGTEGYVCYKIPKEAIDDNINFLEQIREFIVNECELQGSEKEYSEDEELAKSAVGLIACNTKKLAQEKGLALLSDDAIFRFVLKNEDNIKSFSSLALVTRAYISGLIKEEEYFNIILTFLKMKYTYVPVDAKVLAYTLSKNTQVLNEEIELLLQEVSRKETSFDSLRAVICEFLYDLWLNPHMLPHQKSIILQKTLSYVTVHKDFKLLLGAIISYMKSRLKLALPQYEKGIIDEILLWARITKFTELN